MQSIFGAFLTAGYASAAGALVTSSGKTVSSSTEAALTKSFGSATDLASGYPPSVQDQIIAGAKTAFLHGDQWAYTAGIVAVLLGATLVAVFFPRAAEERQLLASYHGEDAGVGPDKPGGVPVATK
jgi:DHA2 family multidrug resistance protein-like MFS transporter